MNTTVIERTRNIGFMAHIDAGKTTTTERVLYYCKVTYKMGEVHDGTAVMDWMDQEQERGITITSATTTCYWKEHKINIIDTPGHVDFTVEVERSLRVLDGAIIILCGVGGVEPQTEKVWYQTSKYKIPTIFYINKMDRTGADYSEVLQQLEEKFKIKLLLMQIPVGFEQHFSGVIDLISMKFYHYEGELMGAEFKIREIPLEYQKEAKEKREKLIETVAEYDMEIMEAFVEKGEITRTQLKKAIRRITNKLEVFPVFLGSSFKNKAVQNLLDAIIDYLPSPMEKTEIIGYELNSDKKKVRKLGISEPFLAMVFKTVIDKHADQIIYLRTYAGKIKIGDKIFNSRTAEKIKISKLFRVHANKLEKVNEIYGGDIAVTVGIPNIATGDTLCSTNDKVRLDQIVFPEPVISSTIEPVLTMDHDRLNEVLNKLILEDPTFKVTVNKDTGQTVISGMGELHIEVIKERIKREFKIEVKLGKPRVSYRESVRNTVVGEDKYVTEIAGKQQTGHVAIEVSPFKSKKKLEFVIEVKKQIIPRHLHKAIKNGIKDSMSVGILAGFPMTDLKVKLINGSYHEDTATDFAYKMAASNALRKACRKAVPVLMEPVMKVEILVQDDYLGEVIGDFNARDGKLTQMTKKNNLNIIDGFAPLSNMFGYATGLRTLTQGRANYSMEFHDYIQMEDKKMQKVLKEQLGIYTYH